MEKVRHDTIESLLTYISLDVDSKLETNEFGGLPHLLFLEWCVEELTELDETENLLFSNHEEKGAAVHGCILNMTEN